MIGSDIVTNAAACCFLYCPNCFGNLNMLNIILFPAKIVYNTNKQEKRKCRYEYKTASNTIQCF